MNMQMSPASTHSLTITRWSDWFTPCFWDLSLVHCSFKEEILTNSHNLHMV